ncbi:MAG: hypothetical protein LBQ88_00335 [Treponema sp.]|jgi:hypothetical protein|nr:hypothetical protein [Treponema sp.]
MNKRINFENNIFILSERIRLLRDILCLETDLEIFLEKTIDDIYFINRTLDILLNILTQNKHLIERDTQFDNLSELEWQFSQVLSGFLSGTGIMAGTISEQYRDTVVQVRGQSQDRQEIIGNSIGKGNIMSGEPLVSYDELSELLKGF